jgi:hypothetical protein
MNPKELPPAALQARINRLRKALALIADLPHYDASSAFAIAEDALLEDDERSSE